MACLILKKEKVFSVLSSHLPWAFKFFFSHIRDGEQKMYVVGMFLRWECSLSSSLSRIRQFYFSGVGSIIP